MRDRVGLVMASISSISHPITQPAEFKIKGKWRVGLLVKLPHELIGTVFVTAFGQKEWKKLTKNTEALFARFRIQEGDPHVRIIQPQIPHLYGALRIAIDRYHPTEIRLSAQAFNQLIGSFSEGLMLAMVQEDIHHLPHLALQDVPLYLDTSEDAKFGVFQCPLEQWRIDPLWHIYK